MSAKPKGLRSVDSLMNTMGNLAPVIPQQPKQVDPGTADVVNALFRELQAIFPAWKQAWPDDKSLQTAKRSWLKAFIVDGITTLEQIQYGLQRARQHGGDFAPSVGKFIKWCLPTPEMLGVPPREVAFREALTNTHPSRFGAREWSHPAVRHAALQCEIDNLNDQRSDAARKVFDRAYDISIRMLMNGQPLSDIAVGIGHDSQKTEADLAREHGEWCQQQIMARQAIPANGQDARRALLSRFGLGTHA